MFHQVGCIDTQLLNQEAQSLEHRSDAQPIAMLDEKGLVAMIPLEVLRNNVRHLANPSAPRGMSQYIENRPRSVGDIDALVASPHRHQTEVLRWIEGVEYEGRTTNRRCPVSWMLTRHDQDVPEDLLGEIPMLSSTPPSDVCRLEDHFRNNPRILVRLTRPMGVERNREVQAAAHSVEPPPIGQITGKTSSPGQADVKRPGCIFGCERFGEGAMKPLDISTILGRETTW